MARLVVPKEGYCFKDKLKRKNRKFHLRNPNDADRTVCGFLIFTEDEEPECFEKISRLKPEELCKRCLGPLAVK